MPVTTRIITAESGSTPKATSTFSVPTRTHGKRSASSRRCSGASPASWKNATTESTNATATVPHASTLTGSFPKRRWSGAPPSPSTAAPASGTSGIAPT